MTEVIAQKITSLQHSVARAREALTSAGSEFLVRENPISHDLGDRLKRMVGFRNLAVHNIANWTWSSWNP